MSQMDHEELAKRLEGRIDRLEAKIDEYLKSTHEQDADLKWVKGYIRVSVSAFLAVITGLITTAIKVFYS